MKARDQGTLRASRNGGFTIIEMVVALAIMSVILVATSATLQREARSIGEMQQLSYSERTVQSLFAKIEQRLDFGQGLDPVTTVANDVGVAETFSVTLQEEFGFPFEGTMILAPGTANEERVEYTGLNAGANELRSLERGAQGTNASSHSSGTTVLWQGYAYAIEEQVAPPAGTFDGQSDDLRGTVFFRGDGTGFPYRRPVDPNGTGTFITEDGVRWGATIGGRDSEDGCAALVFRPVAQISEADRGWDLNADGDLVDVFDLGRIADMGWDATDTANGTSSLDLVAPIFLQEVDNYGGDLDGDGFDDPIFLWNANSGRLRIRLFALLGDISGRDIVRRFETVLYMRNGAAE